MRNESSDGAAGDLRVPIPGDPIPFCDLKVRPISQRFGTKCASVRIRETDERFSREMKLDFDERDVLRDRLDGRIHVVDVNSTSYGPRRDLDCASTWTAITRLAATFEKVFLNRAPGDAPSLTVDTELVTPAI